MKKINIGLLGFGNVGSGTYETLYMNKEHIEKKSDIDISVSKILVRNLEKYKTSKVPFELFTDNPDDILEDENIDIVVEVLGGVEPATSYMIKALENGKHVVTANKAEILGILNGTTNYILTQMTDFGLSYDDVLKTAQEKGFAEADPTADVEGIDAANKLSILMALAFDEYIHPKDIPTTGITKVSAEDIERAKADNKKIKLIASAVKNGDGVEFSVKPVALDSSHPLAGVSNEFNAVFVRGNAVDELMFYGKGAGSLPTGSAVAGDVLNIAEIMAIR